MSEAGRPSTNSLTRIDVGSLEADLNRFRVQLDQWADSLVARTRNEKDEHLRALGQLADEIQGLQREHQALTEEAERIRQRLQAEAQEEAELQSSLAALLKKQESLPQLISELQSRVNEQANRLYRKQAKADSKAAIQNDVERGLNKIIGTYGSRLGLSLTPKDGAIEIGYKQISRRNPDKMYSVNLRIGDDGVYSVQKVPLGLEETTRSLVEELNVRNDLSSFVIHLRKALVASFSSLL